ncbi:FHA domain-containing protein [Lacipirellula limnantheis]|uniref:Glycogen accumulation regulator GarA n=1 Tax=Lacipirellula limnantheis TaxID=2528024 RepID=A0A517U1Y4_9BACT|nr:FHA domain-containing protein [Lacipirellula limnantheis]QDT74636.1 Glycogen accumulation regulator GarA [Lacipirellula limnantheis]
MADPIRITTADLQRPEISDYVEMQRYLQRDVGEIGRQPWLIRVIYANWFYLSVASAVGGLVGWACLEPWYDDTSTIEEEADVIGLLIFPIVAAGIGLFLGAAEGIICRNPLRAVRCGAVGLGIGFVGGLLTIIPAGILFAVMAGIAMSLWENPSEGEMPTGLALLVLMMGRGAAWAVAGIPAGIGQGIALREKKVMINGLVGGVLGGLIGGLLFDPISLVLIADDGQATYSRAVGFATIGLFVGLFVGLVEGWTKTAWLLMRKGPLAGKQFIMFKDTTVLGSSPKADIYLFKDDAIEPRHALITNRGGRFEIEDCNTPDGTYVNGIPVTRTVLRDGDKIVLGKTVLEFSVKESSA